MVKRMYQLLFLVMIMALAVSPAAIAAPNPDASGQDVRAYQQMLNNCKQMLQEHAKDGQMTKEQIKICKMHLAELRNYNGTAEVICP